MVKFSKTIADKLKQLRKSQHLTQAEVAKRIGISEKFGHSYITRLENYKIKKPYLETILNYLDAIGIDWGTFFTQLSKERAKSEHSQIMSQVKLPADLKLLKKLDRDAFLYKTKITPPINYYPKVDLELLKQKITLKVTKYLNTLKVSQQHIPHYLEFAHKIITADKSAPLIKLYTKSGISENYLIRIRNIALKIMRREEKKVQAAKPISRHKRNEMTKKYLQSRVKFAPLEAEIEKLLDQYLQRDNVYYNFYMNFARQCYKAYKTYYQKDAPLLDQKLKNITQEWIVNKLNPEVLEKVKKKIINAFTTKYNI